MMCSFVTNATHIYLPCVVMHTRKQMEGLSALVTMKFHLDPYQDDCVFLFYNKLKTTLRVLCYDKNGFILASKKLLDGMKFQ